MSGVSYRDLKVWRKAMELAERCYSVTADFPHEERFGLTLQMRRCAVSVAANIAEGYGRDSDGSFVQFLRIAQGSLKEFETLVILSGRVGHMNELAAKEILRMTDEAGKMLRGLIKSINSRVTS